MPAESNSEEVMPPNPGSAWLRLIDNEIDAENARLRSVRTATLLALAGLAGTLLTVGDAMGSVGNASLSALLVAKAFVVFLGVLDLLMLQKLLNRQEFSPFAVASGLGPLWLSFPISLAGFVLMLDHRSDLGLASWQFEVLRLSWITELALLAGTNLQMLLTRLFPRIRLFWLAHQSGREFAPVSGLSRLMAYGLLLWTSLPRLLVAAVIAGGIPQAMLDGLTHSVIVLLGTAAALGICTYGARQFAKYQVGYVVMLRGMRRAYSKAGFPDHQLQQAYFLLQNHQARLMNDFGVFSRTLSAENALRTHVDMAACYFLWRWGRFEDLVVAPLVND